MCLQIDKNDSDKQNFIKPCTVHKCERDINLHSVGCFVNYESILKLKTMFLTAKKCMSHGTSCLLREAMFCGINFKIFKSNIFEYCEDYIIAYLK